MRSDKRAWWIAVFGAFLVFVLAAPALGASADGAAQGASESMPWWFWPLTLLVVTFVMGILAVLGGVGGGVLFVPIISGFYGVGGADDEVVHFVAVDVLAECQVVAQQAASGIPLYGHVGGGG